jgi:putative RecB family exonuclease
MTIKITRIQSPSSINTYKHCPRKYYYTYILKLPTKPSIHLTRGHVAHAALEDFFKVTLPEQIDKDFFHRTLLGLFNMHWSNVKAELDGFDLTQEEKKFYYKETELMLINWLFYFQKKIDTYTKEGLSSREAFVKLTPRSEVEYVSEKYGVRGFIDAIHEIDGKVKLVDYKTSKGFEISPEYKLQLGIYALLYNEHHNRLPDEAAIFFLKSEEKLLAVNKELLDFAKFEIEQIHASTDTEKLDNYPLKPGPLCKWKTGQCDFYEKCFGPK